MVPLVLATGTALAPASVRAEATPVHIEARGQGYTLVRRGKPYEIRGAGGDASMRLLARMGGNSVRTWGADNVGSKLDEAEKLGLTVTVGIWLGHTRHGFSYSNADQVAAQYERARQTVLQYKDHPALLMWGIGNEMEGFEQGDDAAVWSAVNNIAAMVKRLDPHHPTMTVLAEIGGDRIKNVHRLCPDIDVVGVNSYGGVRSLAQRYRDGGGKKPVVVTEFGPAGAWEVSKTSWGAPEELTSMDKAGHYEAAYRAIHREPITLGSYAFLWGHKREGSATWFGLFLRDGRKLNGVDRLRRLWSGRAPANSSPRIEALVPNGPVLNDPGQTIEVSAVVTDPEKDRVSLQWVLEPEERVHVTGGDVTPDPLPLAGAVKKIGEQRVRVRLPETPGPYRLYAYARDESGAATANLPLFARGEVPDGSPAGPLPVAVIGKKNPGWIPSGYMGDTKSISMVPSKRDGREGLRVEYKRPDFWGGVVWQHPPNDWGEKAGGFSVAGARSLSFWAKGAVGGEKVKFGYGLLGQDTPHPDSSGKEQEVVLKSTWKRFAIGLDGADLSRIKSGFYWVVGGQGRPVTFYLSDVKYE